MRERLLRAVKNTFFSTKGHEGPLRTPFVTIRPQYLTSQSSLEPFSFLVTELVYSRGLARQPTRCEEGTRSVRDGFVGGVAGAQPLHKGGPKARPPKIQK